MQEIFWQRGTAFQSQLVELGGVPYVLKLRYSQREDRFYVSIYDSTGDRMLLGGVKVVCDFPIVRGRAIDFAGELIAQSNEAADRSPPGFGELGSSDDGARVQLFYLEASEL